ncbi:PASTA domain-containing protein [Actinocorallia herbida]|uniref:PASTA domain-containing protein n=1 Tax=Actinocorallia herbida TaxID=58109 RepID=A0A3N1CTK2_9ACTN|nr:PASTA domain-containing protein [Actinocorallia herbida]ROO84649.1 PASTA domain-containing protein [Actinocorallia herbida]
MLVKIAVPVGAIAVIGLTVAFSGDDSDKNLTLTPERPAIATATSTVTPTEAPETAEPTPVSAPTRTTATTPPATPTPRPTTSSPKPPPPQPPATQAPPAPTTRAVPDVVGLSLNEAAVRLAQAGFGFAEICVRSREEGVLNQQPAAGQQWNPGGRVALYVASRRCDDHDWGDDDRAPASRPSPSAT